MDNHLVLRRETTPLAQFMRRLLTGYSVAFNRRSGHLFQNRYQALLCEEDAYLLTLVRYVHLIQQGRIEGQISGSDVYGVLVGDNDIQVATFTGSLLKGGMSDTYTTSDGDGNWNWDGPMPNAKPAVSGDASAPSEITALGLEAPDLGEPSAVSPPASAVGMDTAGTANNATLAPETQ